MCVGVIFMCFFFFNQKTAYEMRISDWSSDVCSSDLQAGKGEYDVHDAHDQRLDQAAEEAGGQPQRDAQRQRDGDDDAADVERIARAVHQPGEEIAPRPEERRGGKECGSTWRSRW